MKKNKLILAISIVYLLGCLTACSWLNRGTIKSKEVQASFCIGHAVDWCHTYCDYKISESTLTDFVRCFKCVDCEHAHCMRIGSEEYYNANMSVMELLRKPIK